MLNRNVETEFWVGEKKTALSLCQAKGATAGYCLKDWAPTLGETGRWFSSLGVKNRATDED